MIYIKTEAEIAKMRKGGKILAEILNKLKKSCKPGISTAKIELLARELMKKNDVKPAFLGYPSEKNKKVKPFPTALCLSLNYELVHTPSFPSRIFKEGDLVSIDCGVIYDGLFTDAAITFSIGKISPQAEKLIKVTKKSLEVGIKKIRAGIKLGDVSAAIQSYVEKNGFSVIRSLVGHGVGRHLHEEPSVPNFGVAGQGIELKKGMTLAIEPMTAIGSYEIETLPDGWTIVTKDRSLCAHFEKTITVTARGAEILTKW